MGLFPVVLFSALLSLSSGLELKKINIDLARTGPGQTRTEQIEIASPTTIFEISNANPNKTYFILQIHTFVENVTLSSDQLNNITGTNIGLVWGNYNGTLQALNGTATFYLERTQPVGSTVVLLVAVSVYSVDDPVPGGCNLSFNNEIAPYLLVNLEENVLIVLSQPPLDPHDNDCQLTNVTTEAYQFYLEERGRNANSYFEGIQKMLTVADIEKNGYRVSYNNQSKQHFSRYAGIGQVFAVVAEVNGRKAAYVPIVSYGCNANNWAEDCIDPIAPYWKWTVAVLLIWGTFITFFGHRYFKTSLFTVGYIWGGMIVMTLISVNADFSSDGNATFSLLMGIFFGIASQFLWWKFGSPYAATCPSFALAGLLITSTILYTPLSDLPIFHNDYIWPIIFDCTIILISLCFSIIPSYQHMIALSLVGSYAVVVALSYYTGGCLPYIVVNIYRRLTVKDFNLATINPPFLLMDLLLVLAWLALFGFGLYYQIKRSKGRPPFPPHRRPYLPARRERRRNERTPLLTSAAPPPYSAADVIVN